MNSAAIESAKKPKSLASLLNDRFTLDPQKSAILWRRSGHWETLNWADIQRWCFAITKALKSGGYKKGTRIAILSNSRPEWALVDWSCQAMGLVVVPVYPSLLASEIEYILNDSGAEVLFLEDGVQRAKIEQIKDRLPSLKKLISFENLSK